MRFLVDMNLSADWCEFLRDAGHEAVHWASVGDPRATDRVIMDWACSNGPVIFTHDLDFGILLALTRANGPSVVQVRTQDPAPDRIGEALLTAISRFGAQLEAGALLTVDPIRARVKLLPFDAE